MKSYNIGDRVILTNGNIGKIVDYDPDEDNFINYDVMIELINIDGNPRGWFYNTQIASLDTTYYRDLKLKDILNGGKV